MNRVTLTGCIIKKKEDFFELGVGEKCIPIICKGYAGEDYATGDCVKITGYFVSEDTECDFVCSRCKETNFLKTTDSYVRVTQLTHYDNAASGKNEITISGFIKQDIKKRTLSSRIIRRIRIKTLKYKTFATVETGTFQKDLMKGDLLTVYGHLRPSRYLKKCTCRKCGRVLVRMRNSLTVTAEYIRKENNAV